MKTKAYFHAFLVLTLILGGFAGCSKKPARSDAQIASDVQSKFYGDPMIESRGIQVQAAGGVVTLSGEVASDSERAAAAGDAGSVDGVRTVVNNLQVQQVQAAPPPAVRPPSPPKPAKRGNKNEAARRHQRRDEGMSTAPADNPMEASNAPPPDVAPAEQTPPPPPAPRRRKRSPSRLERSSRYGLTIL